MKALACAATTLVSTIVESWEELRIHRGRVLLSLIGVAVAVLALTSVVAAGAVTEQVTREISDRNSGRPATLIVSVYPNFDPQTGVQVGGGPDLGAADAAWTETVDRYGITWASRVLTRPARVQYADGAAELTLRGVDAAYGEMHRVRLLEGAWLTERDARRLAPALVVNEVVWDRLGRPPLATNPTVEILAGTPTTAVVVGVTPRQSEYDPPEAFVLADAVPALEYAPPGAGAASDVQFEAWVPDTEALVLQDAIQRDVRAALGGDAQVEVYRTDWGAWEEDPLLVLKLLVSGVAVVILALGALGLVNIALVTVRTRIREIGIRRSFGATSGRVFAAVLMESVVATAVAGAVGVAISIALVRSPLLGLALGGAVLDDAPAFPVEAAVVGLLASVGVGALAGLVPALAAVRVRVIDAIRF